MLKDIENWYASWFDTPFYHILYKSRDDKEAGVFMKTLTSFLNLKPKAEILDLACGRGRHSIYLNKLDFIVTGVDLSSKSIAFAKVFETDTLTFAKVNVSVSKTFAKAILFDDKSTPVTIKSNLFK